MDMQELEPVEGSDGHKGASPVEALPEAALVALEEQIQEAGGELELPSEYAGAIGRTMFDTPSSEDGTVTILLPRENLEGLPRQAMARIKSVSDGRSYLGIVVKGPFAEPDGLRADAPPLVAVTVKGGILMPKYHGRAQVELLGEELPDGSVVPPRRRPLPNSPVFVLGDTETAAILKTAGDVCLGLVDGHDEIEVRFPSGLKTVLPRHLGILGTTGGGKSTTVSGLVSQLQAAGVATILLDTEGEYTALCEPTADERMVAALQRRSRTPAGVPKTHVYHLVGRETANPNHPDVRPFSLAFAELSPYTVMEVLGLTDAQQERFLRAYDATKVALDKLGIFPANEEERKTLMELDELDTGYPRMTLTHVYDVVKMITAHVARDTDPFVETPEFHRNRDVVKQAFTQGQPPGDPRSWRAMMGRVGRVKRLGIFDNKTVESLCYADLLQPGRVSIIDLSDTDSPQVNNLVIAQLLRGLQLQQDTSYKAAVGQGQSPTRAMVLIEEAHEFLSAQRIKDMPVLFQQVARIARRGRKRWLGLAFITQLPQHLPDEVLGLINNWILHKISDSNVVSRLRRSIGGIDESLWSRLPGLAPGQAIVALSSLARPVQATIDPTPCRLLMVD